MPVKWHTQAQKTLSHLGFRHEPSEMSETGSDMQTFWSCPSGHAGLNRPRCPRLEGALTAHTHLREPVRLKKAAASSFLRAGLPRSTSRQAIRGRARCRTFGNGFLRRGKWFPWRYHFRFSWKTLLGSFELNTRKRCHAT